MFQAVRLGLSGVVDANGVVGRSCCMDANCRLVQCPRNGGDVQSMGFVIFARNNELFSRVPMCAS